MNTVFSERLAEEQGLALAYTPRERRAQLAAFFALDRRLAQIASKTTEPMLGQMRIAWWRDMLSAATDERPSGDEVLDAIGCHWIGREEALVSLVDAWEILLAQEELDESVVIEFARGRAQPFKAVARAEEQGALETIHSAGSLWALADAATHISDQAERQRFIVAGSKLDDAGGALPRAFRGLAILRTLSQRSLTSGGIPMMAGRGAAVVALRVGLLGR